MPETSAEIARRLAMRAIDVCRRYLPNGKRVGEYWIAGDIRGAKGKSLYVRIVGPLSGNGAAGKWTDSATSEHGDLLDLIAASCQLADHRDVLDEARRFLSLASNDRPDLFRYTHRNSTVSAQRLFAASAPIAGTLAETYLRSRGVTDMAALKSLRFHPRCYYRADAQSPVERWPALIAAVTDPAGAVTGVQRTYLQRDGSAKAPLATPRKAMGLIAGNAVRFGKVHDIMAVGEGVETVLALRTLMPSMPMAAALSAQNLGAFRPLATLKRLYIAADRDEAGMCAAEHLRWRAVEQGVDAVILMPILNDFNDDLLHADRVAMASSLYAQLDPTDRAA
jgi:hypothetical protein